MTKKGKKPFLLKRSIGARIIVIMIVVILSVLIVMQLFIRNMVSNYTKDFYTSVGDLISSLVSEELGMYPEAIRYFGNSEEANELRRICTEYNLHALWVETSVSPYEEGRHLVYLADEERLTMEELDRMWAATYPLTEEEKAVFRGETVDSPIHYINEGGAEIVGYVHGLYDAQSRCYAVIGVTVEEDRIIGDIESETMRLGWILSLIFIALIIITGLILHSQVFKPLSYISGRMEEFIDGDRMNTGLLPVKGEDELCRVAESYNTMTAEIRKYVGRVRELEKEQFTAEAEINVAAQIQTGMLPPAVYRNGSIYIGAVMKPARDVAGDFYDYCTLPDGRILLTIGDVSGKGVSAALFMTESINAIRYNALLHSTPSEIMRAANNDLCARNPEMLFVTAYAAIFDPVNLMLTYCNAGHNPAYIIRDGSVDTLTGADCLFLGMFPDEEYTDASIRIQPGYTFFLYTDGLTETIGPGRTLFGQERVEQVLADYTEGNQKEHLTPRMLAAVKEFAGDCEAHDDLTMLTVHFGREIVLPAVIEKNAELRAFLFEEENIPLSEMKNICLAAEEIFVNICRYAYENIGKETEPEKKEKTGHVRVDVFRTADRFILRFTDTGIPYDPLQDVIDPTDYDPDRHIGGLGKFMTFNIMDERSYEYKNGCNILTLTRILKEEQK